jgi:23S rRNA-/tRNA-specific pseudouridylate synthase
MAAIDATRAAGLVHRLDTGTSGLLVAARTADAFRRLRAAFRAKAIAKEYLAVVRGRLTAAGRVTLALERRRTRMVPARAGGGWDAASEYWPIAADDDLTLVHLRMRSGVTHQLRVHLAHIGHPVLGDRRYGDAAAPRTAGLVEAGTGWHYLHALRLRADDSALLPALATPFPRHWEALVVARGWRPEPPPEW